MKDNHPLPKDSEERFDIIKKYDEVRIHFLNNPDPKCIPLFLNSFGEGSGIGVYQHIEDVLLKYSTEEVLPYLISALKSEHSTGAHK
ncbi:hypothetical protein [Paenibacillus ehimensis]|uniref:hypothetical protein n=1 Tax=Paenibacillus ehimensis TaxID=79264 RepID=UPI0020A66AA9|nr:hypothetical protein [Paenibacillus ehimensis]